jgi:hypothetical protein
MAISQWLGLGALTLLAAFIGFAFRQGDRIKRPRKGGYDAGGLAGGDSGGGYDSGGHSGGDSGGGH